MTKCILCQNRSPRLIKKDFGGLKYIKMDGTIEEINTDRFYDIWHCDVCDTRFVTPYEEIDYEKIYLKTDTYDGLLEFAQKIKTDTDPWWSLIGRGQQYYVALDFLKGKQGLTGLEVGCGYGYMTYALSALGHKVAGLEVSDSVVKKCEELYGKGFFKSKLEIIKIAEPPDFIVALEVIEHLVNPLEFMKAGKERLKEGGSFIISTPSREYLESRKTGSGDSMLAMSWTGEMPPIHFAIYSKKSMEWLAKELNMKLEFTSFPGGPNQTMGATFTK